MNPEQRERAERGQANRTLPPLPIRSRHPDEWTLAVRIS